MCKVFVNFDIFKIFTGNFLDTYFFFLKNNINCEPIYPSPPVIIIFI
jgi:hypothetical protein